LTETSLCGS